jgi:uncharacterized membrane protein (UPF0127 family)
MEGLSVLNMTRHCCLSDGVRVADSFRSRLVGLLRETAEWTQSGAGLWIVPCCSVHTMGLRFPIDILFLDRHNVIVNQQEFLSPGRISRICWRAASVLELPPGTIARTGTAVGDQIEIRGTLVEEAACRAVRPPCNPSSH